MEAVELVRELLAFSHTSLEVRIDARSPEKFFVAQPGSGVVSPAAIYAHIVLGEDHFISTSKREPLLYDSGGWRERLGFEPFADIRPAWAESLRYDVATMRAYAEAVYARSDAFLQALPETEASRPVPNWQVIREDGKVRYAERQMPLLFSFMDNVTLHTCEHAGEIAIVANLGAAS